MEIEGAKTEHKEITLGGEKLKNSFYVLRK
jgi:hypothetical protein